MIVSIFVMENLESLFGGFSRGAPTPILLTQEQSPHKGADPSVLGDMHMKGLGRKGQPLANQISLINPGDQWDDRCHSKIALRVEHLNKGE